MSLPNFATLLKEALDLKTQYFSDYEMDLDHATMFTYNEDEYSGLKKEMESLGVLENEDQRGALYKLNDVIAESDVSLAFFKIAKPNIHTHTFHHFAFYFKVEDFEVFSNRFNSLSDSDVVKAKLPNKLELLSKSNDVILSIVPVTEPAVEDIEAAIEKTSEEKDLSRLQSQLSEEQMKRIQVMADFQNYQKRVEQEKTTWGAVSNMSLIREMLEVYDDIHLALNDENLSIEHAKTSMRSAQDKLVAAVTSAGIEVLDVKVGEAFDKEKMEAVTTVSAGEEQKGKVVAVISSAYKYKDREFVLKPAKVVIGK